MQVAFETFGGGSVNHDILIFYKIILCFIVSKALDKKIHRYRENIAVSQTPVKYDLSFL